MVKSKLALLTGVYCGRASKALYDHLYPPMRGSELSRRSPPRDYRIWKIRTIETPSPVFCAPSPLASPRSSGVSVIVKPLLRFRAIYVPEEVIPQPIWRLLTAANGFGVVGRAFTSGNSTGRVAFWFHQACRFAWQGLSSLLWARRSRTILRGVGEIAECPSKIRKLYETVVPCLGGERTQPAPGLTFQGSLGVVGLVSIFSAICYNRETRNRLLSTGRHCPN
jgi:hypothetical protein